MATTDKSWDGSASRWPDTESFCKSCLIDENESGQDKTQANCKLPVYEPNGDVNSNAVHAAAAALAGGRGGVKASPASKKSAAKKLIRLYGQIKDEPPDSLKKMAQ